ncbi:hypothetical protein BDN67DRAFT_963055 [Paxillus ammoniavirescens]|nr:hypothetical protein BDN67DRAFT_963055 [Paxillus ammoniavirescens]
MNYQPSPLTLQRIPGRTQLLKLLASGIPLQVTEQQKVTTASNLVITTRKMHEHAHGVITGITT